MTIFEMEIPDEKIQEMLQGNRVDEVESIKFFALL